ncbi:MAG: NYN domain-containing protein [Bdellovibrionales bacterium]|nr:NYN domain-containing protein [Bdellovibrionales bacterium]
MGRDELEVLKGGVVKRKQKRRIGLFIDATGLDRATRRLERKVDLSRLVSGLTSGIKLEVARYYCLIPYEDDARQFAFLDAVERAGIEVVTKRLPPKGVKRQVSMDVHLATDLVGYSYGFFEQQQKLAELEQQAANAENIPTPDAPRVLTPKKSAEPDMKRLAVIVCPSREMSYAIFMANQLGVETSLADFGLYGASDGWKGVDKWIDLSTSETIWRD